ncbi:MAG TPA: ATP-binding protein [Pseudonocardiaceae bacterium]|jgi:anti-anti-sigma regulatory factor|nr:ATP-binding protein [Pseudonocardiaceae bacterium]
MDCLVVTPLGDLDSVTYRFFRDDLVKFAMDQPRAVIVVVDDLRIASSASLTAFSSAWMRIGDWPAVPILLVAHDAKLRATLTHSAIARFVPVHAGLDRAMAALRDPPARRRTEVELCPVTASSRLARVFVRTACERWQLADRMTDATEVATELVENAIVHAGTDLRLRLELRNGRLTVAVRDGSPREAVLREWSGEQASGLRLVAHLSRVWGCAPDLGGGKIVWAVLA